MKNPLTLMIIGIVLVVGIALFALSDDYHYETKQNYVKIEQKVEKDGIYYIAGRDPYIHNSKMTQIFVKENQFEELEQNAVYYLKYTSTDGKIFELSKIVHKK